MTTTEATEATAPDTSATDADETPPAGTGTPGERRTALRPKTVARTTIPSPAAGPGSIGNAHRPPKAG